jgi:hypothetical protein
MSSELLRVVQSSVNERKHRGLKRLGLLPLFGLQQSQPNESVDFRNVQRDTTYRIPSRWRLRWRRIRSAAGERERPGGCAGSEEKRAYCGGGPASSMAKELPVGRTAYWRCDLCSAGTIS